jgi:hypothetical protein
MAYPGPPRRASGLLRYVLLAAGIVGVLFYLRHSATLAALNSAHTPVEVGPENLDLPTAKVPGPPTIPLATGTKDQTKEAPPPPQVATPKPAPKPAEPAEKPISKPATESEKASTNSKGSAHPIDDLIKTAEKEFAEVLKKESHDVKEAAAAYRKRRGRHPPPGFDVWFDFAKSHGAVMVEDFFDQIYHDLGPYWGLDPAVLRRESWDYEMAINVRGQKAKSGSDWFWTKIWLNMTQTIEDMLPDIDIPLNAMDEPRILAPWEEVNRLMEIERKTRTMPPPSEVLSGYRTLPDAPDPQITTRPKNYAETRKLQFLYFPFPF